MMPLLEHRNGADVAVVCSTNGRQFSYAELTGRVSVGQAFLARLPRPALLFQVCNNTLGSIVAYLSALSACVPVCLLEPNSMSIAALVASYEPTAVVLPPGAAAPVGYEEAVEFEGAEGWRLALRANSGRYGFDIWPGLALLLTTSGSTGSPKLVRLTLANLVDNARSIAQYLGIGPGEKCIQSLPMHYSYGLSLINSHLVGGGTVVLTSHSFMRPEFWAHCEGWQCTSFAGVPYMYEVLKRLGTDLGAMRSLHTLTQAGGALGVELIKHFHHMVERAGKRFFVMYGQTEATARISYVPAERLAEKYGAIGIAIPGGRLELQTVDANSELQQLVYSGPNVMLGYATQPADLASGDIQKGRLETGDLGRHDTAGFYYLTGRLKRFAKVFGRRINMADIERYTEEHSGCRAAAVERSGHLAVFVEGRAEMADFGAIRNQLAKLLMITPTAIKLEVLAQLPMTGSGKKDYRALEG